jgi:hypothetical protein
MAGMKKMSFRIMAMRLVSDENDDPATVLLQG